MSIYKIHRTHQSDPENFEGITVDEKRIDQSTDLTFFGRQRLQYGQDMNQNILHLLETFSLPEKVGEPGVPDLEQAAQDQTSLARFLSKPVDGQLWFNQTRDCLYFWSEEDQKWVPMGMQDDLAANWGIIYHGQTIPKPVSAVTGRVFEYDECSWIVSPYNFPDQLSYMSCRTSENAIVDSTYRIEGGAMLYQGYASYLIVGIRDNKNIGSIDPDPSPTPTPTSTRTPTPTRTKTPLVSQSSTPAPVIPTPTPTPPANVPLQARVVPTTPRHAGHYSGPVNKELYPGEAHLIPNPLIYNGRKLPKKTASIQYAGHPDYAPTNPWVAYTDDDFRVEHVVWVKNTINETGESTADVFSERMFVLCSDDGINGLIYGVRRIYRSGRFVGIALTTGVPDPILYLNAYTIFPQEVGPTPDSILTFNYKYVYPIMSPTTTGLDLGLVALNPPTGYGESFNLEIWGGKPPYYVVGLHPERDANTTRVAATYAGMGNKSFDIPIRLCDLNSNKENNDASYFLGVVDSSYSDNVSDITISGVPGKRVTDFIKTDLFYPYNYTPYPGGPTINWSDYPGACRPTGIWRWNHGNSHCAGSSGFASDRMDDSLLLTVRDSNNSIYSFNITSAWKMQVVDHRAMDSRIGFSATFTPQGFNPRNITTPGTYVWDIKLSMENTPTTVQPEFDFEKCRYFFSILRPREGQEHFPGNWQHRVLTGSPELSVRSTGRCFLGSGNSASSHGLVHVSNADIWPRLGRRILTPYTGTSGSRQAAEITSYTYNDQVVDISNNPIIISLYPINEPNTFTWRAITNRGADVSSTTPDVPPNLRFSITIPPGLTKPGTLNIPIAYTVYDRNDNCHLYGNDGGFGTLGIYFDLT